MRARLILIAIVAGLLAGSVGGARAERAAEGDLVASFDATVSPSALPRSAPAPVAVEVDAAISSISGDNADLPQLRGLSVAINRHGRLFARGLPVCRLRAILAKIGPRAHSACRGALVGVGAAIVLVHLPKQPPFSVRAHLLAFNGPRRGGGRVIWVHAYARRPPGSFVLPFRVSHKPGVYGTLLTTTLPERARKWAYLTGFHLTLQRTYVWRGARHSYVSAACPAPAGFNSAIFPFARADFRFASVEPIEIETTGRCTVRGT